MRDYPIPPERLKSSAAGAARVRAIATAEPDPKVRNPDSLATGFLEPELDPQADSPEKVVELSETVEQMLPGAYHFHNARTMYIDSLLRKQLNDGVKQIVLLGAGYDSRAYRFGSSASNVRFFEVDLPELQQDKKDKVTKLLGSLPRNVTYVPIDFNIQRLGDALSATEYDNTVRSFFNWEGVSYYLTADGVDTTLSSVSQTSPPGSTIVFDYMPQSMIQGTLDYYGARESRAYMDQLGESFKFGIEDGGIVRFLSQRGFSVLSDFGPKDLEDNYLIRIDGQLHGRVLGFIRIVHAEVEYRVT